MKRMLSVLVLALAMSAAALAQDAVKPVQKQNQKQRFEAEKVAFLTSQLDLSVEEAQAFWPVYNKVEASQKELEKAQREAFKALNTAIKEQQDEKTVANLLDAYIKATQANVNLHMKSRKDYEKVLSQQKVAKFYVLQERFRRMQINNLRGGNQKHPQGQHPGQHPGQNGQFQGHAHYGAPQTK